MDRKMVTDQIIRKQGNDPILVTQEILDIIKIDDFIDAGYEETYYDGDSGQDSYYYFYVSRDRLENDEEYKKRMEDDELKQKWRKDERLKSYLKLKKEFESEKD